MSLKIHEQAADDIAVTVPVGWPEINVGGLQVFKSLEKKVNSQTLKDFLELAADEISKNFDMEVLTLPLAGLSELNFRLAVYELAYSKLIPSLPVNNQHDSDRVDLATVKKRVKDARGLSLDFQREIPGFSPKVKKTIASHIF